MADNTEMMGPLDADVLSVAQSIVECSPKRTIEVYGEERTLAAIVMLADYVLMLEGNRPLGRLIDRYDGTGAELGTLFKGHNDS